MNKVHKVLTEYSKVREGSTVTRRATLRIDTSEQPRPITARTLLSDKGLSMGCLSFSMSALGDAIEKTSLS